MNQPLLRWNNNRKKKKKKKNDEDEKRTSRQKKWFREQKTNRFQLMSIVKQFQMRKMVDWQP